MARRVVLIKHSKGPDDDLASARLAALGYDLDIRHPHAGETLGEPDGSVAATLLYGGADPADPRDWHTDRFPFIAMESRWVEACMARDIPTVGFCLGGCIISHVLGAAIGPHPDGLHEFGYYALTPTGAGRDLIPEGLTMPESHYHGFGLPDGAIHLARSEAYPHQAYRYGTTTFAFQFHPECSKAGFARWQTESTAHWGKPGAQTREEQTRLAAIHRPAQKAWLDGFLSQLISDAGP